MVQEVLFKYLLENNDSALVQTVMLSLYLVYGIINHLNSIAAAK